jgi:hypothetical protein
MGMGSPGEPEQESVVKGYESLDSSYGNRVMFNAKGSEALYAPGPGMRQISPYEGVSRRPPNRNYLVDRKYLGQSLKLDGIGFGKVYNKSPKTDSDFSNVYTGPSPPPPPPKYDVTALTQKYELWKELTGTPDSFDASHNRRIV